MVQRAAADLSIPQQLQLFAKELLEKVGRPSRRMQWGGGGGIGGFDEGRDDACFGA